MAEDSHREDSPPQGGVFGNLPDSRPGARSPRRRSGDGSGGAKKRATSQGRQTAAPVSPQTAGEAEPRDAGRRPADAPPTSEPAEATAPPARSEGVAGIEDLAWAGVAAAAEAATLGIRLASRALDSLRGSAERD